MSATAVLSTSVRESDPKPSFCSRCFRGADEDTRFFDGGSAFDAGSFQNTETLAYVSGSDDLHLCESCVREFTEALGYKPELHGRQFREIQRLEVARDHYREAERRSREECDRLRERIRVLEADREGAPRRPGRPKAR